MSKSEVMDGPRTSYEQGAKLFTYLKKPRNFIEHSLFRGVVDFTNLNQFNAFETGYAMLFIVDVPQYIKMIASKDDFVKNMLNIFITTVEGEFKSLSGLGSIGVNTNPISDNITELNMVSQVTQERTGTFSMPFQEKTGAPISRFIEFVLKGIKDPSSTFKTYHGILEEDYSMEAGFEKETFTFLYCVTDNTGRELERAMLLTACQPQSVPFSELYEYTKGTIENPEISLEFSYYSVESIEINKIAREILDWYNNDLNPNKIVKNDYEKDYKAIENLKNYSTTQGLL